MVEITVASGAASGATIPTGTDRNRVSDRQGNGRTRLLVIPSLIFGWITIGADRISRPATPIGGAGEENFDRRC